MRVLPGNNDPETSNYLTQRVSLPFRLSIRKTIMRKPLLLCCLLFLLSVTISPAAIVFTQKDDHSVRSICVIDDNGTQVRLLTDQLNPSSPRWSPDGKQIVFTRGRHLQTQNIAIMNADGTNIRDLTPPFEKRYTHPSFSSDGKYIVFNKYDSQAAREPVDKRNSVMVMRLATGRIQKISNLSINRPDFSPDGRHIIFTMLPTVDDNSNVWIMKADGGDPHPLLPPPLDNEFIINRWNNSRWSPDGQHILYTEDHDTFKIVDNITHYIPLGYYYFICDQNGNNVKKLNIPKTLRPVAIDWMDDGKSIVFSAREALLNEPPPIKLAQYKIYKYHIASGKLTTVYVPPPGVNAYTLDWISDDVLSVSPHGKKEVAWGHVMRLLYYHLPPQNLKRVCVNLLNIS